MPLDITQVKEDASRVSGILRETMLILIEKEEKEYQSYFSISIWTSDAAE